MLTNFYPFRSKFENKITMSGGKNIYKKNKQLKKNQKTTQPYIESQTVLILKSKGFLLVIFNIIPSYLRKHYC